jgi:hypothetical protein
LPLPAAVPKTSAPERVLDQEERGLHGLTMTMTIDGGNLLL